MPPRSNVIAVVVASAFFMQNLDGTIVTTALPQIGVSLGVDPVRLNIMVTAYFLSNAIFIPISGWLADRFGVRNTFQVAIAVFTLTSLACAMSNSLWELTAARIVQGAAGAMIVPVGRFALLREVKKGDLVKAIAYLTVPTQLGTLIGPVVGGAIVAYASWRWIFLINIPFGLVGILLAARFIENYRPPERRPLDWRGFLLSAAALFCVLYALDELGRSDVSVVLLAVLCAGVLVGWLAFRHMTKTARPLMDLSLLRVPTFAATLWGGLLVRVSWGGLPFILSLLFQVVFGLSALTSGILLLGSALGSLLIRIAAPWILARIGFRSLLIWNGFLSILSFMICGLFNELTPVALMFVALLVGGLFQALQVTSLNSMAYADVDTSKMNSATAISQLTIKLGKALGVAAAAFFINQSMSWRGPDATFSKLDILVAVSGIAAISICAIPFFWRLRRDAGSDVSGHSP